MSSSSDFEIIEDGSISDVRRRKVGKYGPIRRAVEKTLHHISKGRNEMKYIKVSRKPEPFVALEITETNVEKVAERFDFDSVVHNKETGSVRFYIGLEVAGRAEIGDLIYRCVDSGKIYIMDKRTHSQYYEFEEIFNNYLED